MPNLLLDAAIDYWDNRRSEANGSSSTFHRDLDPQDGNVSMTLFAPQNRMPKLHSLSFHVLEIVDYYGSLSAIAEQSFEHY